MSIFKLAAVCFSVLQWPHSYFNESDLQVAGGCLGHLHQESRLVGVVFHDVVVHVDEDPGERKGRLSEMELKCRRKAN